MAIKKNRNQCQQPKSSDMSEVVGRVASHFNPDIEEMLFLEITVGGDAFDREFVYMCTKDYSEVQMASLKTSLQTRLSEFHEDMMKDGLVPFEEHQKVIADVDKDINVWLGEWPLLAGKMDYELSGCIGRGEEVTEKIISDIAMREYNANFSKRKMIGAWALNRCKEMELDPTKLDTRLTSVWTLNHGKFCKENLLEDKVQTHKVAKSGGLKM